MSNFLYILGKTLKKLIKK
jgi:hypothetical protein